MRYSSLFQTLWSFKFSQTQVETVETGGRANDNETTGTVDETDGYFTVFGEMGVCFFDVFVYDGDGEVADAEHGRGVSFVVGEGVGEDGGGEGGYWEGHLGTEADAEEGCQCDFGLSDEGRPIGRGRDCQRSDNSLGVSSGPYILLTMLLWGMAT